MRVSAGAMNSTRAQHRPAIADATATTQPTDRFTVTHSRSRQVARSCSSNMSRRVKLSFTSPVGGGRYGSAIGTPHHSPASRLVRLVSRRMATSVAGPKNRPMPSPAASTSKTRARRWLPWWVPLPTMRTPAPSAVRPSAASQTSSSPSPASISPKNTSPRAAATRPAPRPSPGRLRCGEIAVTIT